ncbi:MAG: hypothetical protein RL258_742, partial [Pseudomonadota bacterium]
MSQPRAPLSPLPMQGPLADSPSSQA